jgi:hypothetical protein
MEKDNSYSLEKLKEEYGKIQKKYSLPTFQELNELFDIEDIDIETDFLLRRVRRVVSERMEGYLKFTDMIMNPQNSPMFFFKLMKKLDSKDREMLTGIYEKLGNIEVELIELELDYSEKKEADFIKKYFSSFQKDIKPKLLEVISRLKNISENEKKFNNGSYFG